MSGRNWLMSSTDMDDVIYLYTVETKKDRLVEVIDLAEENQNATGISKKSDLALSKTCTDKNNNSGIPETVILDSPECPATSPYQLRFLFPTPYHPPELYPNPSTSKNAIKDVTNSAGRKCQDTPFAGGRLRDLEIVRCSWCSDDYDTICTSGNHLFSSSKCGHLFCTSCLKYKWCPECKERFLNLCKVSL